MEPRRAATTMKPDAERLRLLTLGDLDGRTNAAKRARTLVQDLESDLGGPDHLSAGQRELVTRIAVQGALLEDSEARMLAGQDVPLSDYLPLANAQRRLLATLGLERRTRDVTPDLRGYLQARSA